MKKTTLSILLCGVLCLGLTGCGEKESKNLDNKVDNKQNTNNYSILSCTNSESEDNGTGRTSFTTTIDFKYDSEKVLETITITENSKYNSKEATQKKKESEESMANISNSSYDDMKVEVKSNDSDYVTTITTHYIDKMSSETLNNFKYKNYINSKRFDVDKFKADYEKENKNAKCSIK